MTINNTNTPPSEKDLWATPQWLYNWLNMIFQFDIDLAAIESSAKHELWIGEGSDSEWIGDENDSLAVEWSAFFDGGTGFLNPPYSDIKPWVNKAVEEQKKGFTTVMLIPTPNGEKIYKSIFDNASTIIYINGRVSFIDAKGVAKGGNTRGSCVVIFGEAKGLKMRHVDRDMLIRSHSDG